MANTDFFYSGTFPFHCCLVTLCSTFTKQEAETILVTVYFVFLLAKTLGLLYKN